MGPPNATRPAASTASDPATYTSRATQCRAMWRRRAREAQTIKEAAIQHTQSNKRGESTRAPA